MRFAIVLAVASLVGCGGGATSDGGDLFAPGQPLACSGIAELAPPAAETALRQRGYDRIAWFLIRAFRDPLPDQTPYHREPIDGPPPEGVIVGAEQASDGSLMVSVAPRGDRAARPPFQGDCQERGSPT